MHSITFLAKGDTWVLKLERRDDGTMGFRSHENSGTHEEAVEVMVTLPATTRDIGEQLSQQHAAQKVKNSEALLQIMSCIRFLSRQVLAMRGDGNESDGNLQELLYMKAADNPNLADRLKRKENVYTSPDIQNEIVKTMGIQLL